MSGYRRLARYREAETPARSPEERARLEELAEQEAEERELEASGIYVSDSEADYYDMTRIPEP